MPDWLSIAGSIASLAGAVFAGFAWWKANAAKRAAEEARRSVRELARHSHREDRLRRAADEATQMLHACRDEEAYAARLVADRLTLELEGILQGTSVESTVKRALRTAQNELKTMLADFDRPAREGATAIWNERRDRARQIAVSIARAAGCQTEVVDNLRIGP